MALTDQVIMPGADYQAAANQVRALNGTTATLKSGEMVTALEGANDTVAAQTTQINALIQQANNLPDAGGSGGTDLALGITGATVGQIAKITAVDSNGKPTAWTPVDMPSGGVETWETIDTITLESGVVQYVLAHALTYKKVRLRIRKKHVNTGSGNCWIGVYTGTSMTRFLFDSGAVKASRADVVVDLGAEGDGMQMEMSYGNNIATATGLQRTARVPFTSALTANSVLRLDIDESYTEAFDGTGTILVEGVRK